MFSVLVRSRSPSCFSKLSLRKFAGGKVKVLGSDDESFKNISEATGKKILYFTATWCPPCRKIGPFYEQRSTEFSGKSSNMTIAIIRLTIVSSSHRCRIHKNRYRWLPSSRSISWYKKCTHISVLGREEKSWRVFWRRWIPIDGETESSSRFPLSVSRRDYDL